jgi:hypothetical protein
MTQDLYMNAGKWDVPAIVCSHPSGDARAGRSGNPRRLGRYQRVSRNNLCRYDVMITINLLPQLISFCQGAWKPSVSFLKESTFYLNMFSAFPSLSDVVDCHDICSRHDTSP